MSRSFIAEIPLTPAAEPIRGHVERLGFKAHFSSPQLVLYGETPETLEGPAGAIVGHLYEGVDRPRLVGHLSDQDWATIVATGGEWLLKGFWGRYVAFWLDADRAVHVLRDPSGSQPCYYLERPARLIISDDAKLLHQVVRIHPQVDWDALTLHLRQGDTKSDATTIAGVKELHPGHRLEWNGSLRVFSQWSPWDYVRPHPEDREALARRLRKLIVQVVGAEAGSNKTLVTVSGGLDSSVVAAALSEAAADWVGLTMVGPDYRGDERRFTQALGKHLGAVVCERTYEVADVSIGRAPAENLPRPLGGYFMHSLDRARRQVASETGASSYLSGNGGDGVFCYMRSATPLVDRAKTFGPSPGLWRTLSDICDLTGCSVGEAAGQALRRATSSVSRRTARRDDRFLGARSADLSLDALDHEWLTAPPHSLPGKAVHIEMILRGQGAQDGYPRVDEPPLKSPLMAQPIMELCLGIPSWEWCAGGVNRSVARLAFADTLPLEVLRRTSKGSPDGFSLQLFQSTRPQVRTLLLDGRLAGQGVIDADAIEAATREGAPLRGTEYDRLLDLAATEAWVQSWVSYPRHQTSH